MLSKKLKERNRRRSEDCKSQRELGGDGPCLWNQPFWRPAEMSSKAQGGIRWGEGESHRWYGRERCCATIVGILRWWKKEQGGQLDRRAAF